MVTTVTDKDIELIYSQPPSMIPTFHGIVRVYNHFKTNFWLRLCSFCLDEMALPNSRFQTIIKKSIAIYTLLFTYFYSRLQTTVLQNVFSRQKNKALNASTIHSDKHTVKETPKPRRRFHLPTLNQSRDKPPKRPQECAPIWTQGEKILYKHIKPESTHKEAIKNWKGASTNSNIIAEIPQRIIKIQLVNKNPLKPHIK